MEFAALSTDVIGAFRAPSAFIAIPSGWSATRKLTQAADGQRSCLVAMWRVIRRIPGRLVNPAPLVVGDVLAGPRGCCGPIGENDHSMAVFLYEFGWDPVTAKANLVHTFEQLTDDRGRVRLISARQPTRADVNVYEEEL